MKNKVSNLNIANILSFSRIVVPVPLIYCLNYMNVDFTYKIYTILIILYIFISDVLDGYFARKLKHVTDLGKIMDPVADKICLIVVLIYLIDIYHIPFLLFFILISIRDILLLTYTLYLNHYYNHVTQANIYGKVFIFITTLMIISFIFNFKIIICQFLYYTSLIMMFVSTYYYIKSLSEKIREYEPI